jgi:hypothetical protein
VSTPQTIALSGQPAAIDDASLCGNTDDFHNTLSRVAIGIVLRPYFDAQVQTPLEIIHLHKPLRALIDQGALVENAVLRVANAQGRMPDQDPNRRRAALREAVAESQKRARAAQLAFAGLPGGAGLLDRLLELPASKTPTGNPVYDRRYAMASELAAARTWQGKLDRVMERIADERTLPIADEALADLLGAPAVLERLFGTPPGLGGTFLVRLCELAFGEGGATPALGALNGLFRQGRLPESRLATLDRVRRLLRAPQPLGRGEPAEEADALQAVLPLLLMPSGVIGGERTAEALTIRYSRRLEQGGASAFRRSVIGLAETQSDLFRRSHYLAAVARVPAAARHLEEIAHALSAAFGNDLLIENVLAQASDFERLAWTMSAAQDAVGSSPLPGRERLAERLGGLFDEAARNGRLFERLRQAEPVPRRRIIKLAELALSGLVTETGGLGPVRRSILDQVRQNDFQRDLAQLKDGDAAQAEIRQLHVLLDRVRRLPGGEDGKAGTLLMPETLATLPAARSAKPSAASDGSGLCPNCFEAEWDGVCRACGYPQKVANRPGVHLMPGASLHDRYRIGRLLGQGGFGATYLGWDARLEAKVAIKEYYPATLVSRPPGGQRVVPFSDMHAETYALGLAKFLEEARMLARLREIKEIVVIHDFFEENGTAYLVMELLLGRTLKRYIGDCGGAIDARRTLTILAPIMKALQGVHDRGLIHRDVSPDNIFLTVGGERKLLDFGAARHAAGTGQNLTVILKPGYAPPEQYAQDAKQGPWTDVYAMCATIYCALTGKLPPDATSRFMKDSVPPLANFGVIVPPAFERTLLAGLSMRASERPQSMRDLLRLFTGALGQ